jgi:hypothetical protein
MISTYHVTIATNRLTVSINQQLFSFKTRLGTTIGYSQHFHFDNQIKV